MLFLSFHIIRLIRFLLQVQQFCLSKLQVNIQLLFFYRGINNFGVFCCVNGSIMMSPSLKAIYKFFTTDHFFKIKFLIWWIEKLTKS